MSWLSKFLNPEKGYDKAQDKLDQYYTEGQGYLNPYNQFGQESYGNLSEMLHALMNPEKLQGKWIDSYSESPAAIQAEKMAQEHGLNAANSMGLMGSNTALNAIQSGTSQIGLEDRQKYLDDLMQKYMTAAGIAGNIFGTGAGAAGQMGQNATTMGQNSAQLAFGKENAKGDLFGKLLGTGVGLAGSVLGGPIGGDLSKRWNLSGSNAGGA